MELIIVLIILFFVVNSKKTKGGEAQSQQARRRARDARPGQAGQQASQLSSEADKGFRELQETMRELAAARKPNAAAAAQDKQGGQTPIEAARSIRAAAEQAAARAEARRRLDAARRAKAGGLPVENAPHTQGQSLSDEEGCLGGSMEHTHTEGEGRAEHAQHVAEAKRREAEELLVQAEANRSAQVNAQRLRDAVVMAEVLGKPKALRARGQIAR